MPLKIECVVDRGMGPENALGGWQGLEPQHLAFSSPDREMRILSSVVLAKWTWSMTILQPQQLQCGAVRGQTISDDALRLYALVTEQSLQQLQGSASIAALLHDEIVTVRSVPSRLPADL
jgi:hypothetical protein